MKLNSRNANLFFSMEKYQHICKCEHAHWVHSIEDGCGLCRCKACSCIVLRSIVEMAQ